MFTESPLYFHLERGKSSFSSIGTGSRPQDWSSWYQYFPSIKARPWLGRAVYTAWAFFFTLAACPAIRDRGHASRPCRTRGRAGPLAELGGALVELACRSPLQKLGGVQAAPEAVQVAPVELLLMKQSRSTKQDKRLYLEKSLTILDTVAQIQFHLAWGVVRPSTSLSRASFQCTLYRPVDSPRGSRISGSRQL